MRSGTYSLGLVLTTASAIAWSTAGLFTRLIEADLATTLVWRGVFGAIGICAFALATQGRGGLATFARLGAAGWAFAIVSAFGMLCFIASLRLTTVAHVAVIYAAVPFAAAGLGWLVLAERPSRSALLASAAALAGVAVMAGLSREGSFTGDVLALLMTLAMAAMMVIARRYPDIPTLQAAALSGLLCTLAAVPLAAPLSPQGSDWLLLAGFGLVNSALGLALFAMGSKLLPPVETALIGALDAPLAPLWVWLVFAETPGSATLAGGAIVFTAVVAHVLASTRRA